MFEDKKELFFFEQASPIIAIIDDNKEQSTVEQAIQKVMEITGDKRPKILFYTSIEDYLSKNKKFDLASVTSVSGLIDLDWINLITTKKPSCVLYLRTQNLNNPFQTEEQIIFNELKSIQENDRNIQLMLYIINPTNQHAYEFENSQSIFSLRKKVEDLYFPSSNDFIKSKDFKRNLFNVSKNARRYYRNLKQEILNTMKSKQVKREDKINYNIKLGYLSMMKSKKQFTKKKYFEEAYNLLVSKDFNISQFYYGSSKEAILNFYQTRLAADWLFYKIFKISEYDLDKGENKINFIFDLIKRYSKHYSFFMLNPFYKNEQEKNIYFKIIDCIWNSNSLETIIDIIDKLNFQNSTIVQEAESIYSLKRMYCATRLNKLLNNLKNEDLAKLTIEDKEITLDKIKVLDKNSFFESLLNYEYAIDPLNYKPVGFSCEILVKKYLTENKIEPEIIRRDIYPRTIGFFEKILKDKYKGVELYLNTINIMNDSLSSNKQLQNVDLKYIFSNIDMSKSLIKFPKIYFTYLGKYNDYLIQLFNNGELTRYIDKLAMYNNLIKLGNQRPLREDEENIFFKLFKDEEFINLKNESSIHNEATPTPESEEKKNISKELINVNSINNEIFNNNLFNFDYKIISGNDRSKKVLDLVQYQFTFSTCLKEKIKFDYIEFIFADNKRVKKFTSFPNDLSKDTPIILDYKILLKDNEDNLMLEKVLFSFEGASRLTYEIRIHSSKDKIIMLEQISKKVLDFRTPKSTSVKVGLDEYYHFETEIFKEPSYDVDIGTLEISFYPVENTQNLFIPSKKNTAPTKVVKSSMAASFEKMANKGQSLANNNYNNQMNMMNKQTNFVKGESYQMQQMQPMVPLPSQSSNMLSKKNLNNPLSNEVTPSPAQAPPVAISNDIKKKKEPEFYIMNEEGNLSETLTKYTYKVDNFEEIYKNGKRKISFLVRFREKGFYTIEFSASYNIVKKEIEDESIKLEDKGKVNFDIVAPLLSKFDTKSSSHMETDNMKSYDINKNIIIKLTLTNELNNEIIIKNITTTSNEDAHVDMSSSLYKIIKLDNAALKKSILTILKSSEYSIPFNCIFKERFDKKSFGKVSIDWTTESLNKFSDKIYNNNVFDLPEISVETFNLDFNYEVSKYNKENNSTLMKLFVSNKTSATKKIDVEINKSQFLVQGKIERKIMVLPYGKTEIEFYLSPISYGVVKLPTFKVKESDICNPKVPLSYDINFCKNIDVEF